MASLRKVEAGDMKLLFDWANDAEARQMSIQTSNIPWEDHVKWFEKKLLDKDTKMFILVDGEKKIGQVRFEWKNNEWLIGYSIAKEYRGKGYGKQILGTGIEEISTGKIAGYVKPENISSIKIFKDLGFIEEGTIEMNNTLLTRFCIQKNNPGRNAH